MKTTLFLAAGLLAITASAQRIELKEGSEKFSTGSQNAISTTIFANNQDDVQSAWKSLMKDYKNEKVKSDKNEVFGDNILIKEFGNNPVDVYATFEENKKDMTVKMHVAFDLGGAYLTSSSEQKEKFKEAEKIIKAFAVKMTKEPLQQKVKDAEKVQSNLEDDQKDLEKENKNLKGDIEDYKGKISKAEKEITEKEAELTKKKGEVEIQKKVVDASAGAVSEQAKASKNILDKLQGQQKDIEKDIKGLKSDIDSYNGKIKKAEDDIKKNESDQDKKKSDISKQKDVVSESKKAVDKVD
jgi:predicted  nucleic acid-binding Zn-ribbon protein